MSLAQFDAWDAAATAVRCLETVADLLRYASSDFAITPTEIGDLLALVHGQIDEALTRIENAESAATRDNAFTRSRGGR